MTCQTCRILELGRDGSWGSASGGGTHVLDLDDRTGGRTDGRIQGVQIRRTGHCENGDDGSIQTRLDIRGTARVYIPRGRRRVRHLDGIDRPRLTARGKAEVDFVDLATRTNVWVRGEGIPKAELTGRRRSFKRAKSCGERSPWAGMWAAAQKDPSLSRVRLGRNPPSRPRYVACRIVWTPCRIRRGVGQ